MKINKKDMPRLAIWGALILVFSINFCVSLFAQNTAAKVITFILACVLLVAFFVFEFMKAKKHKKTKDVVISIAYAVFCFTAYLCNFLISMNVDSQALKIISIISAISIGGLTLVVSLKK